MRPGGGRTRVAQLAFGLWLLVDVLRMWTPSLITVLGRAAETPPELIGGFAVGTCAVPLLLTWLVPHSARVTGAALAVLVGCRVALLLTDGGRPQLVLATLGTVAGIGWLALVCGTRAHAAVPGLAWGLLLDTTTHAALGTYAAVWRHDVWGVLVVVLQVGALLALHRRTPWESVVAHLADAPRRPGPPGTRSGPESSRSVSSPAGAGRPPDPVEAPGRVVAWLVFPVLLLAGVLLANAARASAALGPIGPALAVAGCVLAVLATHVRPRHETALLAGTVLVVVTGVGMFTPLAGWGAPALAVTPYLLGLPAAVLLLGGAVRTDSGRGGPVVVAGGAVVWVVVLFVYYAGYDLGYRADLVVVLLALAVAVAGIRAAPQAVGPRRAVPGAPTYAAGVLAVALAVVGPAATLRPLDRPAATGSTLHLAAWNLRMGYGIDGRFDAVAVARTLVREHVDVALLSEIDRGWLLNGGQDQLRILARLTGMHLAFGAAADPVWGDAILSRVPLHDVRSRTFPSYGAVTGAEVLQARLTWHGRVVTVGATHLQPGAGGTDDTRGQAAGLARLIRRETELGTAVVGGDLNTEPGSRAWRTLVTAGMSDALGPARPLLTAPADDPSEQIDHVFVDPRVGVTRPRAVRTQLSDHFPVLVDLSLPAG